MSKETEQPPSRLTLEQVTGFARETLLRDGYHRFTIIAEATNATIPIQIPDIPPTHVERVAVSFRVGWMLAETQKLDELVQAFQISEAWMSTLENPTDAEFTPPSQDPNRKEVLAVSQYVVATQSVAFVTYEMGRDDAGKVVTLNASALPDDPQVSAVDTLLNAFVAGFRAGKSSRYN